MFRDVQIFVANLMGSPRLPSSFTNLRSVGMVRLAHDISILILHLGVQIKENLGLFKDRGAI